MGRARQIAGNENQDRIILDSSDGTADAGDFLLLDASAATTDDTGTYARRLPPATSTEGPCRTSA